MNQYVGGHIDLLVHDNYNVAEFDYGCGPSSDPANGHVSSFQIFNQVLKNKQGIYVSAYATSCDVLNNSYVKEPDESSPVHYHLPPTPQFEHVENLGNAILSGWTPWVQHTTSYLSEEFVVDQVFNSKSDLQKAEKIYSIKAH